MTTLPPESEARLEAQLETQVRALLAGAGLKVPDDELAAIASGVAGARAMAQLLHRCDVSRAVSGAASR